MQPRSLSRAWGTKAWIKRLSGLTLEPSTVARGVAKWIASLPGSRVSPSASPASEKPRPTSDGSGQTWREYLAKYDRNSSSWKTCQGSFLLGLETFSATWPRSGSMRNGVVFERPMLAPATGGNGGSAWQTPRVRDHHPSHKDNYDGDYRTDLGSQAKLWQPPRAIYGEHPGMKDTSHLTGQAQAWATPQAHDSHAGDAKRVGRFGTKHGARNLNDEVLTWPTPKTRDYRSAEGNSGKQRDSPDLNVVAVSFLPDQVPTGPNGSPTTRTLNPRFVEALMGWPIGWTDCERAVTGLSQFKQRMRGALW